MQINILNVQQQTKTGATGKPYTTLEVAYKDSFGKVASKTLMSFGAQANAYKALATAKSGDVFSLTVVKNDKGYIDWTNAVQAPPGQPAEQGGSINNAKTTAVKSTYETPEERAKRQILIVRQSSLSSAVATLTAGAKSAPSFDSVVELANKYFSWVMQDPEASVAQDIFNLPNDIEVQ